MIYVDYGSTLQFHLQPILIGLQLLVQGDVIDCSKGGRRSRLRIGKQHTRRQGSGFCMPGISRLRQQLV